jgi:hypothetical protein
MGRILPRKRYAIACREDNRGEDMNIENKTSCANRGIGRALVEGVRRGAKWVYAGTRQPPNELEVHRRDICAQHALQAQQ